MKSKFVQIKVLIYISGRYVYSIHFMAVGGRCCGRSGRCCC